MTIPIARPFVGKEEEEAVVQALRRNTEEKD